VCSHVGNSTEDDDQSKVDFITAAMERQDFFTRSIEIDSDITNAIEWMSQRSAEEVLQWLERAMQCAFCSWDR